MKKREMVDYYRHIAGKSDQTGKYHAVVVVNAVCCALNSIVYETFAKHLLQNLDLYMKTYTDIAIAYDSATASYYSVLPTTIMQLPLVGDGVRNITPSKGDDVLFIPMTTDDAAYFKSIEVGEVIPHIGYTVLGDKVMYACNSLMLDTVTKVKMRLVRPFEAYNDEEEFYVPSGQDERLDQLVLTKLGIIKPDSLKNDNNGNLR